MQEGTQRIMLIAKQLDMTFATQQAFMQVVSYCHSLPELQLHLETFVGLLACPDLGQQPAGLLVHTCTPPF